MWKIQPNLLENLGKHKYSGGEYTLVEKGLDYYWTFVENLIPEVF